VCDLLTGKRTEKECLENVSLEEQLEQILTPRGGSLDINPAPLLVDFRRLVAGYTCSANGNETICKRFQIGPSGHCMYHGLNNSCEHFGIV